ncbi:tyrosine-type recombinase/integrase [Idiomarina sp. OT37-5b]|uniref:tyrosine-type recombinase/integrase n=1 Tax=Idiomarina sp. OT37-5b TaxID=2100422 RepID=UPI0021CB7AC0|nr:site-specific integrase [Idiomarina sp. OT37-5b]
MGALTVKQLDRLVRIGDQIKISDGRGLYFVIPKRGEPYFSFRFTNHLGKRREMTLGQYPALSLAQARNVAEEHRHAVRQGQDVIVEAQREKWLHLQTCDDVFKDWYENDLNVRLKHPNIPKRLYSKEISPVIGTLAVGEVTARDIREIIRRVRESGRPSIANDVLMYAKQFFNHAIRLDLTQNNPAAAFRISDAGGVEKSRDRVLSYNELKEVLRVMRENQASFGHSNYLAVCLLLLLGVRKSELLEAKWEEFDLDTSVWVLPSNRSKTGVSIRIPLSDLVLELLNRLKFMAANSDYVFPARRSSKRACVSGDTLNRAIAALFGIYWGREVKAKIKNVEYFRVHDLRRTCRSLLAELGVQTHIAERCLNHKLRGVEHVYNRHDYFNERRDALEVLAKHLKPIL